MIDLFGDALTTEMKKCSKCGEVKPISEFGKANGANYARPHCSDCERELGRIRKKLREENKHTMPDKDYQCPICGRTEEDVRAKGGRNSGTWCCDHDHSTNKFRGWICHSCNRALGAFNEDIGRMKRAMDYLQNGGKI